MSKKSAAAPTASSAALRCAWRAVSALRSDRICSFKPSGTGSCLNLERSAWCSAQCCSNQAASFGSRPTSSNAGANWGSSQSAVPGRKKKRISLACRLFKGLLAGLVWRAVAGEGFPELGYAASDTRLDGAHRHVQDRCDLLVGTILEIKQRHRRLIHLFHFRQGLDHLRGVQLVDTGRRDGRKLAIHLAQFKVGKAGLPPPGFQ